MRKKALILTLFSVVLISWLAGQESPVLLTIADEAITLQEFERIYRKNNNEASLQRQTPEEYLELYINFKLKVKEAESLGMDTTTRFINELEGYRKQLARPYLTDSEMTVKLMMEAYERSRWDIHASHILIKLPEDPTPEDTLAAYEKAMEIRDRIAGGEDFETVARATSDDASVQSNGGDLGYFTVFSMIYPFETMAYETPVGELTLPFRTSYGYHIMKVNDRRPARGQVKVAHIFVRTPDGMSETEKTEAYEKIHMVYDSLRMGREFGYMARSYSEDPGSARNDGEMPWFGIGRMIPEFEDACFSIEETGSYTEPFRSFYGWHIIRLLDKKGIGTYQEMEADLQDRINRGERAQFRTAQYLSGLREEYRFTENQQALDRLRASVDSSLILGNWSAGELADDPSPLFSIGSETITLGAFARVLESNRLRGRSPDPQNYLDQVYSQYSDEQVLLYEESKLPEKYPEFRYIYEEYHDGILLFDIMDQRVWSKAVSDTLGLMAFHREHRQDYMWGSRSDAYLVSCTEEADVAKVRKKYKKILRGKLDQQDLNASFCMNDTIPCITLTRLLVEAGENELVDRMNGVTGPGPLVENEDGWSFVILKEVRKPEPKELDDARGLITSDYQNWLESEWIRKLKMKYPVEVNRALLSRIAQ